MVIVGRITTAFQSLCRTFYLEKSCTNSQWADSDSSPLMRLTVCSKSPESSTVVHRAKLSPAVHIKADYTAFESACWLLQAQCKKCQKKARRSCSTRPMWKTVISAHRVPQIFEAITCTISTATEPQATAETGLAVCNGSGAAFMTRKVLHKFLHSVACNSMANATAAG